MSTECEAFVERYGGIYEHSAWVAEQSFAELAGTSDPVALARVFQRCVDQSSTQVKLELIRAHPDLAGKAAISGQLNEESTEEQARAGIDNCSAAEFEQFQLLNEQYKAKFGFPFVMAVRHSNRQEILAAFADRLDNPYDAEFAAAIAEIHKIARLRLDALAHN